MTIGITILYFALGQNAFENFNFDFILHPFLPTYELNNLG